MQSGSLPSLVMAFLVQHLWGGVCSVVILSALGEDPPKLVQTCLLSLCFSF